MDTMALSTYVTCAHKRTTFKNTVECSMFFIELCSLLSCVLSPSANEQWHWSTGKSAKDLQKHMASMSFCRANKQQRHSPSLSVRLWFCPSLLSYKTKDQQPSLPISVISQENALKVFRFGGDTFSIDPSSQMILAYVKLIRSQSAQPWKQMN